MRFKLKIEFFLLLTRDDNDLYIGPNCFQFLQHHGTIRIQQAHIHNDQINIVLVALKEKDTLATVTCIQTRYVRKIQQLYQNLAESVVIFDNKNRTG